MAIVVYILLRIYMMVELVDEFLKSNKKEFKIVSAHIKRSEKRSVHKWKEY